MKYIFQLHLDYINSCDQLCNTCNNFTLTCHISKIHLDGMLTATGVTYLHHGIPKHAIATKEIIISAGAINSPQLLMLSGIGPQDHLLEVGVT